MLTDGELHSKSREPFPLCSGRTRMVSKNEIYHWLYSVDRQYNMLWLSGPAGVGKSAVAQDIGEFMLSSGFIGAAVFLSRSRRVHDSERLIVLIAGQLASKIRSYNQALMLVLEENPTVFGKGKKILFEKLLVEPFSTLKHWPKYRTYLIIIDGLDECRGKMEQVDIIRLIAENLNSRAPLPLLWMICSRPEHHLREVFTSHDLSGLYWEHDLSLDNPDFRSDIEIYVAGELTWWRAHNSHNPSHSPETPFTEGGEVKQITDLASGFFVFASIMMRSMHNSTIADPISHLSTILNSMHRLLDSFPKNDPLGPLHALYLTVLDNLEAEHLPRSLTLLGSCAVYPPIPVLHFANLLGIGSEYFYASLQPLHPVLFIPCLPIAWKDSLRFLHVTFPDFLTNSNHSGLYVLDLDAQRSHLIDACFHVLNDTRTTYAKNISWRPPEDATSPSALSVSDDIFTFITNHTWDVFAETSSPSLGVLRDTVISFDFSRLQQVSGKIPVRPFIRFISWFCKVVSVSPCLYPMQKLSRYYSRRKKRI
ncbi:hypothetical protein P691DRAFT_677324 [Macrolepiota fuliginosa MF-IS2]|uniref:Nephrocystin 3-like N-terminal domain-containing protein n=1 Tax=Macrolepiota fuliginosa MF-IS2 TaxID=1400762 RepID=A0A9P5X737_9AGAR|nr:hypothetical protein P691DRAFT_677324 [Macrolepiota fuliginosa MF-IS2]